jgi:choline/glycine/proline betaine transport protein
MAGKNPEPLSEVLDPPPEAGDGSPARSRINWFVFGGSAATVLAFILVSLLAPEATATTLGHAVAWIAEYLGWWYFALAAALVAFVLYMCLSRYGRYRLGPEESRPEFSLFTWAAMLFAAGIGADLMFYSVAEPVAQYMAPPTSEGQSIEAAEEAVLWTLFHYGISGWAMYAVMGMALGYFSFRHGLPLSIRSALYPIFGRRVHGRLGDGIDLAAVIGTIFGIATSLGISIALLNAGLSMVFGVEQGRAAQVGLVIASVVLGTASAVTGIDKGIRRLSELNVLLSIGLMIFVLLADDTGFLLNAMVMNIGDYVSQLPGMSLDTMPYQELENGAVGEWKSLWTLFFWAWWVAWAPFVGLFLARISRGRTIRQFLLGVLMIPFSFIVLWATIFGNSAIVRIRGGDQEFGLLTSAQYEQGFYTFLDAYPAATFVIFMATLTGFLYYVTSADSGALIMGNFTSRLSSPRSDCTAPVRIFWSVAIGVLTIAMMTAGGDNWLGILTGATIIMGLPFSVVLALVAVGLHRAMHLESLKTDSMQFSLPAALSAGRAAATVDGKGRASMSQRLRRTVTYPDREEIERFLELVARPALEEVAAELNVHGLASVVRQVPPVHGLPAGMELRTDLGEDPGFVYRLKAAPRNAPTYAVGRLSGEVYYRTEVHLAEGSQGYCVHGYSHDQMVGDVLDQYERHMSYLHLLHDGDRHGETPTVAGGADSHQEPEAPRVAA